MQQHAYRLFEIGENGHIVDRYDLPNCINDDDARRRARQLLDGHAIEVWDGACLIDRVEPVH
jgi:hypothetical protein